MICIDIYICLFQNQNVSDPDFSTIGSNITETTETTILPVTENSANNSLDKLDDPVTELSDIDLDLDTTNTSLSLTKDSDFVLTNETILTYNGLPIMEQLKLVNITYNLCDEKTKYCKLINESLPSPEYSSHTCNNVISKVKIIVFHNGSKGIDKVDVDIYLSNITSSVDSHQITFQLKFKWTKSSSSIPFERSGSPGYIIGKPILAGRIRYNTSIEGKFKYDH